MSKNLKKKKKHESRVWENNYHVEITKQRQKSVWPKMVVSSIGHWSKPIVLEDPLRFAESKEAIKVTIGMCSGGRASNAQVSNNLWK